MAIHWSTVISFLILVGPHSVEAHILQSVQAATVKANVRTMWGIPFAQGQCRYMDCLGKPTWISAMLVNLLESASLVLTVMELTHATLTFALRRSKN